MAGYLARIAEGARPLRAQQRPGRPRTPLPGTVRLQPARPAPAPRPGRPSASAGGDGRAETVRVPEEVQTPVARPDGDTPRHPAPVEERKPRGSADRGPAVPIGTESASIVDTFRRATRPRLPTDRPVHDHVENAGAAALPEARASADGPLRKAVADVGPRTSSSPAVPPAENAAATATSVGPAATATSVGPTGAAASVGPTGVDRPTPAPDGQETRVTDASGPRATDPASALAAWLRSPPTDPDAGRLVRGPGRAAPATKPVTVHIGRVEVTVASPPRRPAAPAAPRAAAAPPPAALALFRLRG